MTEAGEARVEDELDEIQALAAAAERDGRLAELEARLETLADAVAQAATEVIPSKSVELRRLMDHAASLLEECVNREGQRPYHSPKLDVHDIAAMAEAAAILRTVAVYVTDSPT